MSTVTPQQRGVYFYRGGSRCIQRVHCNKIQTQVIAASPISVCSVATGGHEGARAPNPSKAGSWELPKSEEKKIGCGVGVPDYLGQASW